MQIQSDFFDGLEVKLSGITTDTTLEKKFSEIFTLLQGTLLRMDEIPPSLLYPIVFFLNNTASKERTITTPEIKDALKMLVLAAAPGLLLGPIHRGNIQNCLLPSTTVPTNS